MIVGHLPELIIVLVVALIVFGPSRLPEMGSAIGKSLREFRQATGGLEDAFHGHDEEDAVDMDDDPVPYYVRDTEELLPLSIEPTIDTLANHRAAKVPASEAVSMPHEDDVEAS